MSGFKPVRKPPLSPESARTRQGLAALEDDIRRGGQLLENLALTTSPLDVSHALGRRYRGFDVVKRSAGQHVYQSDSGDDTKFIRLTASGSVTVSIYVF